MKVAIVGTGYVGLSLATLISQKYSVVAVDIDEEKVKKINNRISPIVDKKISDFFENKKLDLVATVDYEKAFVGANYIIICTPTNYDAVTGKFDTSSVESVIEKIIELKVYANIVIKSTIPVGYTDSIKKKYNIDNIFFSPEFLREGKALEDNLFPSRIVVGSNTDNGKEFAKILKECAIKNDIDIVFMNNTEAEAVKLFANTYLAMRVAYFNELDTFAEISGLNSEKIIKAVCLDPRIGEDYCNPSFGYGGYCLPKDTKQLRQNYKEKNIPQKMIEAIVEANSIRKKYIADRVLEKNAKVVGVYKLAMKKDSDNYRESAIQDIINILNSNDVEIIIYEPTFFKPTFKGCEVTKDLNEFKKKVDLIIANRFDSDLEDVGNKVYTRDIYGLN